MKRKKPYLLAGLVLLLSLLCTACGNTEEAISPQDDPNEGLGGGVSEDTVNDFSGFEGIWLGRSEQRLRLYGVRCRGQLDPLPQRRSDG